MPATIKDIAKKLNLSVSTVSYALNGGPRSVSKAVEKQVLDTAAELGYRRNRVASNLVSRSTKTIGILPPYFVSNLDPGPFTQKVMSCLMRAAREASQDLLLFTAVDRARTENLTADLLDGRIDGAVFIAPPENCPTINAIEQAQLPYAILCSAWQGIGSSFEVDNMTGSRMALDHLYSLGHRKIGHISGLRSLGDARLRHETYLSWMSQHNLPVHPGYLVESDYLQSGGYEAAREIFALPDPPTALFIGNDEMAVGFLMYANEIGASIPDDMSIVGFDDTFMSELLTPRLTTIRQPMEVMAMAALNSVVAQSQSGTMPNGTVFSPTLITRSSTTSPKKDPLS